MDRTQELEDYCHNRCRSGDCGDCSVIEELSRLRDKQGSIIKGGGVSKPEYWDNDQYAEYLRTTEGYHELTRISDPDEPDDDF